MSLLKGLPHERDTLVIKGADGRIKITGIDTTISISTLLDRDFPPFNADLVIARMMASPKWKESKYFGMSADQIKLQWDENRSDVAMKAGTELHRAIEQYLKSGSRPEIDSPEFSHVLNYFKEHPNQIPHRTEWPIYQVLTESTAIVGILDYLVKLADGSYAIIDWKRTKMLHLDNTHERANGEFSDLPNSDYYRYAAQLSYYGYLLQSQYNIMVSKLMVIMLHPENQRAVIHRVPFLLDEVRSSIVRLNHPS